MKRQQIKWNNKEEALWTTGNECRNEILNRLHSGCKKKLFLVSDIKICDSDRIGCPEFKYDIGQGFRDTGRNRLSRRLSL